MTEGWFKKLMGDLPSLVTVAGALIALGIWVGNLKNQIDNSQQQVEQLKGQVLQLQDILQKSQTATSSGLRGPAGPKGDTGDIGPQGQRGERGPQGEPGLPGAAADPALIKSLVQAELQKIPLPNIPSTLGSVPSAAMPKQTSFTSQQCAYVDDLRATEVIEIQVGTEICERSGKLLAKLTNISINGYMGGGLSFDIPGRSDGYRCFRMEPCELPWIPGRTFTIERFKGNGSSTVAQLRAD